MTETRVKEYWEHFFEKPKKHYNPYMERLKEYPEYIMYDADIMLSLIHISEPTRPY